MWITHLLLETAILPLRRLLRNLLVRRLDAVFWGDSGDRRPESWESSLQELADTLGGRVMAGLPSTGPLLSFEKNGCQGRLQRRPPRKDRPGRQTELHLLLAADSPVSLAVVSRQLENPEEKYRRLPEVTSGEAWFDEIFLLRGSPPEATELLLCEPFLKLVNGLQKISGEGGLEVYADRGKRSLRIVKHRWFSDPGTVLGFTRLGVALAGKMRTPLRPGAVPGAPVARPEASPLCPLCGFAVAGGGTRCPGCGAVLHQECWLLNDGCTCGHREPSPPAP